MNNLSEQETYRDKDGTISDSVELTEKYLEIEPELEAKIKKEMIKRYDRYPILGSCHYYWDIKKRILNQDYGIEWESPAKLNPDVFFD